MITSSPISRLTILLQDLDLTWILPDLRQDVLVWHSLMDPVFWEKFYQQLTTYSDISPVDFSPASLALLALDKPCRFITKTGDILKRIDDQPLQMAIRSFNDQISFQTDPPDLATAGLLALSQAYRYQATNTWNGLLATIRESPLEVWLSPLACLYGFVDDRKNLFQALVQPGNYSQRIQLAVHMLLSNPIPLNEKIAVLMDTCQGTFGDIIPPHERLVLIQTLYEQRPQVAADFCLRWLELQPESCEQCDVIHNTDEAIRQLEETNFNIAIRKISGREDNLPELLAFKNVITDHITLSVTNYYVTQLSTIHSSKPFTGEVSSANERILSSARQGISTGTYNSDQAEAALTLARQGLLDEATQILPPNEKPLPDDPYLLYAIAEVSAKAGDHLYSLELTKRIAGIINLQTGIFKFPVWGEYFSLVNLAKLLLVLKDAEHASEILTLALKTCPNDASILNLLAESQKLARKEQDAASTLNGLVALYPDSLDYHRSFADSLEAIGEWDAGLAERTYIIESSHRQQKIVQKGDIYAYASSALKAGHPELSLMICDELLSTEQEDCQALIYSGKACLQMGETDKGLDFLNRSTQVAPENADSWLALAEAQKEIYPLKTIIDTLNHACQSLPNSAQIHYELGLAYVQDETPSLALPELESAVSLSPETPEMLVTYGEVLHTLGHIEESLDVLSKAYRLEPNYRGLAHLYARILVGVGRLEEAIAPLELLIDAKDYNDPTPFMDYARCVLSLNKIGTCKIPPMKALIVLNEILRINPGFAEAKALIAESLAANGDHELAFQAYREALDSNLIEDNQWLERLSFGFGCVANAIGKNDVAIAALQEASQINPTNPDIQKALSKACLASNFPEEALKSARNVLVIEGDDPDNLAWFAKQAELLILKEKPESANLANSSITSVSREALNALSKAIQLAPTRTDLLVQLGHLQANIGELSDSQQTFSSIAELDFANIDDLENAADFLSGIGDHQAAVACLENALNQDQKSSEKHDPFVYIRLAEEYLKYHDPASAINILDKAIALIPDDSSLIIQKIDIQLNLNQPLEALKCLEGAIDYNGNDKSLPELLFSAAKINRVIGNILATIKYINKGITAYSATSKQNDKYTVPVQYRALVADVYRSLVQPAKAYKILESLSPLSETEFANRQDYLDFICIHTELALETGEQIRPEFQELQFETTDPSFARFMAIKARLMNKAGNHKQAAQILQLAVKSLGNLDKPEKLPIWSVSYDRYLALNSIIEAALDTGMWEIAENSIQNVIDTSPNVPWLYLSLVKSIVLKAEFYNLCEIAEVSRHNPGCEAISIEAYNESLRQLDCIRSLMDAYKPEICANDCNLMEDEFNRWQSRAEIAFKQYRDCEPDPCEVLAPEHSPADAAAIIYRLHQMDLRDPSRDSTTQIIKAARQHPRNPLVFLQVALAIHDVNPEDALKSLQSSLEQNPYSRGPYIAFCNILLAKIAANLREPMLAQKAIENAIEVWRDEPGWHALAAQYYEQNDVNGAINHLLEATKLSPKNIIYHLELGKTYLKNAHDDNCMLKQACKSFETALDIDSKNVVALMSLANSQYLLNEPKSAEANARTALMLAPNRADIYQLLGEIAIRNNDYQGAYEYAKKAIQLSPKDVNSTIILARSLAALSRHVEALEKLDAMLPICIDEKPVHLERVNILRQIHGSRAGLDELKKLVHTYPDDFCLLNALAKSFMEVGEAENAIVTAQQAIKNRTDNTSCNELANLYLLIGQILRRSGQLDQSIYNLEEAIQLSPNRLEPYLELGLARKERREYQQALQIFEHATSIDPHDPRAPFQAGLAFKESKDYKSSEMMLRRAISLAPNDINIRRQLAVVVALNLVHNPRSGRN